MALRSTTVRKIALVAVFQVSAELALVGCSDDSLTPTAPATRDERGAEAAVGGARGSGGGGGSGGYRRALPDASRGPGVGEHDGEAGADAAAEATRGGSPTSTPSDARAGGPSDTGAGGRSVWTSRDAELPLRDGDHEAGGTGGVGPISRPDAGLPSRDGSSGAEVGTDAESSGRADASEGGRDEEMISSPEPDAGVPEHDGGDGATLCGGTDAEADRGGDEPACKPLGLELLTSALKSPVYATAPVGDARIFVLERLAGTIAIVDGSGVRATPFLDVSSKMETTGYEVGLLSLVFHPDFATNRTFYVSYTTLSNTLRISRFTVPATTPDVADAASESVVIDVPKLSHHNTGGMLLFGPDGTLHIGVGDDDSEALGQDLGVLNGKLLRIFVNPSTAGYTIPPDNPFIGVSGALPEIRAYGLREPYRFWFDEGDLYIADVGDNQREEVDVVPAAALGQNFGWPIMEGSLCHTPASGCNRAGLEMPAYEYPHDGGTAVIGGSVYRGTALSACFQGRYFVGSYSAGWIRTFRWDGSATDIREEPGVLAPGFVSFGQDGYGEILMLGYDLTLHRLVSQQR